MNRLGQAFWPVHGICCSELTSAKFATDDIAQAGAAFDWPVDAAATAGREAPALGGLRFVRQPKTGKHHAREVDAEFLKCLTACY